MASYVAGTRRLEEMIAEARRLAYQENYSYTEGWDDNTMVEIFNLAMDRLYGAITEINNPANIEQTEINTVAGQQSYDIPIDVHLAVRIMDVRFLYGTQAWEFVTLRQAMIQDRFSYPTNIPDVYTIRNGKILLSPTPNITKDGALIINYQKRMRKLDIRRGKVSSYTEDGNGLNVSFTLNFTVLSEKDNNMYDNGLSILDKVDYCCIVDRLGNPVVDAIPLQGFNKTSLVLTAIPSYSIPTAEKAALDAALNAGNTLYVVQGDYSSTHSELDRQTEDYFIEYAILRLLRLQSAAEPTQEQLETEEAVLKRLMWAYRRSRPAITKIIWEETSAQRSWPFGRRGMY